MSETVLKKRVESVDALRGFAVMAILLIHNIEHFIFPVYPDVATQPHWLNILDQAVFETLFALFAGKAYAIFALLFGFTFYVQYENRRRSGKDFGPRFLWRLALLAGFATINAAFFPAGDVLLLFSIVGIILFVVRKWSNKAVGILAVICLLQPMEWFFFFSRQIMPDWGVSEMYAEVAEYTRTGDLASFFMGNITLGQKASLLWAINAGRFWQTAGLFLVGYWLGRKQLFDSSSENARFWLKVLIVAAVIFAPLNALLQKVQEGEAAKTIGIVLDMWQKLAFTGVLVASFMLSYRMTAFRKRIASLKWYGRMSLTNYIVQSILGALIYFPWGLSLAPYCGYTLSLLIGIVLFVLQNFFCRWWLNHYRQGPLENLWHRLTWIGTSR